MCENSFTFMKILGHGLHGPSNPTEVFVHSSIRHQNVLSSKYVKFWTSQNIKSGVSMYLPVATGDLVNVVLETKNFTLSKRLAFAHQCVCGLYAIHEAGYLHLDVKPDNYVIVDGVCKITDFGYARKFDTNTRTVVLDTENFGQKYITAAYRAPEIWKSTNITTYSDKCDIYSLGHTLISVLTSNSLFDTSDKKLAEEIITKSFANDLFLTESVRNILSKSNIKSNTIQNLLVLMLNQDPARRPDIYTILASPLWKGMKKPDLPLVNNARQVYPSKVLSYDTIDIDISTIVGLFKSKINYLPSICLFHAVDIYIFSVHMLERLLTDMIELGRMYIVAASIWISITTNYTEDKRYYDLICESLNVYHTESLDHVICEMIAYNSSFPSTPFNKASGQRDLKNLSEQYLTNSKLYIDVMNSKMTVNTQHDRSSKMILVKDLFS